MKKFDYSYLCVAGLMLIEVTPWISQRCRTIIPLTLSILWLCKNYYYIQFLSVNRGTYKIVRTMFLFFIAWGLSLDCPFIYTWLGHGECFPRVLYIDISKLIIGSMLVLATCVGLLSGKIREILFVLYAAMTGLIVTGVLAFKSRGLFDEVGGARALVAASRLSLYSDGSVADAAIAAYQNGMGNYNYMYLIALLAPLFIFVLFRCRSLRIKIFSMLIFMLSIFIIRNGGLGTPFAVVTIGLILIVVLFSTKSSKFIIGMGTFFAAGLLLFSYYPKMFSFIEPPIRTLANNITTQNLKYRLYSIADSVSIKGGDVYAFERYQLQRRSFETFLDLGEQLLIGAGDYYYPDPKCYAYGNHSTICDKLAREGLIGGIIFFIYLFSFCRLAKLMYERMGARNVSGLYAPVAGAMIFAAMANPIELYYGALYAIPIAISALFIDNYEPNIRYEIA